MLLNRLTNRELCDNLQLRSDLSPLEQLLVDRLILAIEEVDRLDVEVTAHHQIALSDNHTIPA